MDDALTEIVDRDGIRHVVARIARGEDRRDADFLRDCFWPDASFNYGIFEGALPAYLDWISPGSPAVIATQHILGQSLIETRASTARVETHVTCYHRVNTGEAERDIVIGGRYLDVFEKRDGEWRVLSRTMLYDWCQDWGQSIDWSNGLMGASFSADHFTARTRGDFSETFFEDWNT